MIVFKIAVSIFALLLMGFGVVLTISPIPFGVILVIIGFLLFVVAAPEQVRWLRKHWRWFDRAMHRLENRMPKWIAKRLRESDYEHDYECEEREQKNKKSRA